MRAVKSQQEQEHVSGNGSVCSRLGNCSALVRVGTRQETADSGGQAQKWQVTSFSGRAQSKREKSYLLIIYWISTVVNALLKSLRHTRI